jgi:NAD(P)-dependent dehydrogenase (short-subunit alcohol dehydrogenase family)
MGRKSRTILITGASGNLGAAVIKNLHDKGYALCASTGSTELSDELLPLVSESVRIDLTDEAGVRQYIADLIARHPNLDTAVLLVGGFEMGNLAETDSLSIDKQILLNFKTAYHVVRPLLEYFDSIHRGQFVLIGARPAFDPKAGMKMVAYSFSKAMVIHLTELINAWGHGKNITATVIIPSTIDTPPNRRSMPKADPANWVKADDLAETIAFVLSPAGQNLRETVLKVYNEA